MCITISHYSAVSKKFVIWDILWEDDIFPVNRAGVWICSECNLNGDVSMHRSLGKLFKHHTIIPMFDWLDENRQENRKIALIECQDLSIAKIVTEAMPEWNDDGYTKLSIF